MKALVQTAMGTFEVDLDTEELEPERTCLSDLVAVSH